MIKLKVPYYGASRLYFYPDTNHAACLVSHYSSNGYILIRKQNSPLDPIRQVLNPAVIQNRIVASRGYPV